MAEHTTIRNGNLFCTHCGGEKKLVYPMPVDNMTKEINTFMGLHKNCKPTWVQPMPAELLLTEEKAEFWLANGERGVSSETMFEVLAYRRILGGLPGCHPCDPDDFRRCYLLLKTVPEWKHQLNRLRTLSPVWSKLVDNWDKLTELLEDQLKNHKPNGMYELMKKLGC